MKRKKDDVFSRHVWTLMLVVVVRLEMVTAGDGLIETQEDGTRRRITNGDSNPWLLADPPSHVAVQETLDRIGNLRRLLSTNVTTAAPSTDKSFWEEVSEFYSDSNNMAMYCVLPLLVLVYGGCSAIYCVHKCRRYIRRRRHKRRHTDTDGLVAEEERNDLNHEGGDTVVSGSDRQPIKTVSSNNWDDANASFADVSGYNVQRKKTPLPWNSPQEVQRNDSFMAEKDNRASRETNYSTGSRESSTNVQLEREREKLENSSHPPPALPLAQFRREQSRVGITASKKDEDEEEEEKRSNPTGTTTTYITPNGPPQQQPPPPPPPRPPTTITRINEANPHHNPSNPRPIEIVPISRKEYQERMESGGGWDPLHHRPFASRAAGDGGGGGGGGAELERRSGRESAWSIRDEIMAKYDALTSLAMAKKTADVLRYNTENPNLDNGGGGGGGHYPDTTRRKPGGGKKKLIFIAE